MLGAESPPREQPPKVASPARRGTASTARRVTRPCSHRAIPLMTTPLLPLATAPGDVAGPRIRRGVSQPADIPVPGVAIPIQVQPREVAGCNALPHNSRATDEVTP